VEKSESIFSVTNTLWQVIVLQNRSDCTQSVVF